MNETRRALLLAALAPLLASCAGGRPRQIENACKLLREKRRWRKHTKRAAKKWKADPAVMLAIIYKESSFDAKARPPRRRFLGIPLGRPSTAYGYPQALDQTWDFYRKDSGNFIAQRDDFKDAIDFVGWYLARSRRQLGIKPNDAYRNYLAYHEGWGGYSRGTYKRNAWLKGAAKRVAAQAERYRRQIKRCGL
ncbi:MAG: transglycosylase SLT domain-containing protein [Gammaproteobacteria bacterium]|nr:transglycosylase SLT domain-containing protein [Gammaproteobacteria bacterium]